MSSSFFLKPSVQMEPLVCRWYAWPHLISPATAALNITRRHLPIMESYVADPDTHAAAVEEPSLLGGPFVDHGGERVAEITRLIETTHERCAPQLQLERDIADFDRRLLTHGDGRSLEPLYAELPQSLRGMVELVYDTQHQPSVRYLEPLMYRSPLYDESLQELVFTCSERDERKFVLSTPRLDGKDTFFADVPFRSPAIDCLFAMRERPAGLDAVLPLFDGQVGIDRDALVERLFTTTAASACSAIMIVCFLGSNITAKSPRRAFTYRPQHQVRLRNILFNNPYIEVVRTSTGSDEQKWARWVELFQDDATEAPERYVGEPSKAQTR